MDNFEELKQWFSVMEQLLTAYDGVSGELQAASPEDIEITDALISRRADIITRLDAAKGFITKLLDSPAANAEQSAMIRQLLAGKSVVSGFSNEQKALHGLIISIKSLQLAILEKDAVISEHFAQKHEEAKQELTSLQKQKKKLNFMSGASSSGHTYDV